MPDTGRSPIPARLHFGRPPGAVRSFLKALSDRRPSRLEEGVTADRIEGRIDALEWSRALLARYRDVCGCPDSAVLPVCFPHVLAAGLHARMLMRPEFPVRLPGLIHVWHEIRQSRPLRPEEALTMECSIEGHKDTEAGAEFCLRTGVIAGGTTVWEEDTGFISRSARRGRKVAARSGETPVGISRELDAWPAGKGVGRRYARASGDYNPIHLFDAAARRFGFPAAIAHGMWTLARAVAGLETAGHRSTSSVRVRFRRPVLIPMELRLLAGDDAPSGVPFEVRDAAAGTVILDGLWIG